MVYTVKNSRMNYSRCKFFPFKLKANSARRWIGGPSDGTAHPGRSTNSGLTTTAESNVDICEGEESSLAGLNKSKGFWLKNGGTTSLILLFSDSKWLFALRNDEPALRIMNPWWNKSSMSMACNRLQCSNVPRKYEIIKLYRKKRVHFDTPLC